MPNTKESRASEIFADKTMRESGDEYFNPLIGATAEETFSRIGDVMGFLHGVLERSEDLEDMKPGISLVVQTVWTAAQYSGNKHRYIREAKEN